MLQKIYIYIYNLVVWIFTIKHIYRSYTSLTWNGEKTWGGWLWWPTRSIPEGVCLVSPLGFFVFLLVGFVWSYVHKTLLKQLNSLLLLFFFWNERGENASCNQIWSYLYWVLPEIPSAAVTWSCEGHPKLHAVGKKSILFKPWKSDHMIRLSSKKFGKIISKHNQNVSTGGKCGTPPGWGKQSIIP